MASTFKYNHKVTKFTDGSITFNAEADGVNALEGPAAGPEVLDRIEILPWGGVHDLDGTFDAATTPPVITMRFRFEAASPFAQSEYINLMRLKNKHGTLTMKVPSTVSTETQTAPARIVAIDGTWKPPYALATRNYLYLAVTWRLKDYPQT